MSDAAVAHAAKTGRFWPWAYVIIMLPGLGVIGYIVMELVPEWTGGRTARQARQRVSRSFNPHKRYRELVDQLEVADTIANRAALVEECLELGMFEEPLLPHEGCDVTAGA